jgi:hypothetical protein
VQRIEAAGGHFNGLFAHVLAVHADAEQHRTRRPAMIRRGEQHLVQALGAGGGTAFKQAHMPGVADNRVVLESLQAPACLHALTDTTLQGGIAFALSEVLTEAEQARPHEAIVHRQAHETIHRQPVFIDAVVNIPHHAGTVIDFAMGLARAFAVAVHINHEVLAAALLTFTAWLLAGVGNRAADGAVVPLENFAHD